MSRRTLKAGEAIRQVVSMSILTEIQDPRVRDVTVLHVEVSGDMQIAKVHVSIMGNEAKQKLCMKGLQSAAGFLQSKVAKRIDSRYTPKIEFVLNKGVKNQLYVSKILDELLPKKNNDENQSEDENEYNNENVEEN
ncbi:MAG: 30S ribosome-binding factor RbfA [Planctomycetaceae bacterium]|jgi:ribosome-binding factor A|nr:30S ribosome-binding factor RbfA [Planctomycetaceae bacterium]